MSIDNCPKCGGEIECLAGESAHAGNWYCSDEKDCGWQAWNKNTLAVKSGEQDDAVCIFGD